MFVLAVDFGNTTLKAALFQDEVLLEMRYSLSTTNLENWIDEIRSCISLEGISISSVRKHEEFELPFVEKLENKSISDSNVDTSKLIVKLKGELGQIAADNKVISVLVVDEHTPLPIENGYKTPETLGKDRLAAVVGAYCLEKESIKKPTLVIDAGTCITFDFIDTIFDKSSKIRGVYKGGSISLGLQMRFKALNNFTAKLPLLQSEEKLPTPIGQSTQEAMRSGVQFGLISEIKGIIDFYVNQITIKNNSNNKQDKNEELSIVICGGDAQILKKWWEYYLTSFTDSSYIYPKWTIEPNLVLIGLQRIFQFIKNNEDN